MKDIDGLFSKNVRHHLKKYLAPDTIELVIKAYNEPHRYYHTTDHLDRLFHSLRNANLSPVDEEKMYLAIAFHDFVYDPRASDNEEKSADAFHQLFPSHPYLSEIKKLILDTKTHISDTALGQRLNEIDTDILCERNWPALLNYEADISKEFQVFPLELYRKGRSSVLRDFAKTYNNSWLVTLAEHVENQRKSVAIFAGSFNPFHLGHLDVLLQADAMFDKTIVAIGVNPSKAAFDGVDRLNQLKDILPYHEVGFFDGLLTTLVAETERTWFTNVTLVRGLRNGGDLDIELRSLRFMRDILPSMKVVYVPCKPEHEHISSSAIRELQKLKSPTVGMYLPEMKPRPKKPIVQDPF